LLSLYVTTAGHARRCAACLRRTMHVMGATEGKESWRLFERWSSHESRRAPLHAFGGSVPSHPPRIRTSTSYSTHTLTLQHGRLHLNIVASLEAGPAQEHLATCHIRCITDTWRNYARHIMARNKCPLCWTGSLYTTSHVNYYVQWLASYNSSCHYN
jgi:hypothetical protein